MENSPIEAYIAEQEESVQPKLGEMYMLLKEVLPDADEKISYGLPTFWKGRNIIHFGAMKNHIGLYPGGEATALFADKLIRYKTTKGSIHLPLDKPLPKELITEIAFWCWNKYKK